MEFEVLTNVYNGEDVIVKLLQSLLSQTITDISIIIIDDGSTDNTLEKIDEFKNKLKIHHNTIPHSGARMARRKAVKKSKAPILIFIDADISLKNDAIEELLKPFQNETVGIVTGLLKGKGETIVAKSYGNLREIFYKLRGDKNNFDWAPGGFFAIRRNVLDSVGGYEVKKRGSGDLDLSWKVKKKGYTVFFNEKAQAYHADPNTISKIWKREKRIGFMEYKLTRYHLKEIFKIRRLLRFYPLVMIVLIPFLILYAWQIFLVLILTSYILTICIVKGSIKVRSIAWFIFNVMNLAYVSGFISSILHRSGD